MINNISKEVCILAALAVSSIISFNMSDEISGKCLFGACTLFFAGGALLLYRFENQNDNIDPNSIFVDQTAEVSSELSTTTDSIQIDEGNIALEIDIVEIN